MMKILKLVSIIVILALLAACTPAQTPAPATAEAKNLKVALVLTGQINDEGWNASAYEGLKAVEKELGAEIAYSENTKQADYEAAFRDYASKGYNLVFGHGSEFSDAALTVAKEFPDVYFGVTNADVKGPNVAGLDTKNEETGYLSGYILGKISKTKKIGFVGPMEIVAMKRSVEGYMLGAQAACPDCEVVVAYTGSFGDVAKSKETALALAGQGVDGMQAAVGAGEIDACLEKDCYITIMAGVESLLPKAPENIVLNFYNSLAPMMVGLAKEVQDGKFLADTVRVHGFDTGLYRAELNEPLLKTLVTETDLQDIRNVVDQLTKNQITLPHMAGN